MRLFRQLKMYSKYYLPGLGAERKRGRGRGGGRGWSLPACERWMRMERRGQMREILRWHKGRMHQDVGRAAWRREGVKRRRRAQGTPATLTNPALHEKPPPTPF